MSQEARDALALRLKYSPASPRAEEDIHSTAQTDTTVIAMLEDLVDRCPRSILITCGRRDHSDDTSLGSHGHWGTENGPGFAVDLWNADYPLIGDEGVEDVIDALIANPWCWSIGLAGFAQRYFDHAKFKATDPKLVIFLDDGADHVHAQSCNVNGSGKRF